jgi:hypothetical protein
MQQNTGNNKTVLCINFLYGLFYNTTVARLHSITWMNDDLKEAVLAEVRYCPGICHA